MMTETIESLKSEVARFKKREAAIIEALGGVADGGRYLNDILGRIERFRRSERAIAAWYEVHASGPFDEAKRRLQALADIGAHLRIVGAGGEAVEREETPVEKPRLRGESWTMGPVYPGHPVTCALIVLRAYKGNVSEAWERTDPGWFKCEGELDTPTAGGALTAGCSLIHHVLHGIMTIDKAIEHGDLGWVGAGGHKDREQPGQEQANRFKQALREELEALMKVQA